MHEWHAKTRPELPPYTSSPDLILQIRPDPNARMYRTQAQRIWRAEARAKVLYFFNTLSFETEEYKDHGINYSLFLFEATPILVIVPLNCMT